MKLFATIGVALALFLAYAQEPFRPSDRERQQIQTKLKALTAAVDALRNAKADDELLVDVEVYQRAAENAVRFPEELTSRQHVINTLAALDQGLERARQVKAGNAAWPQFKGRVSRAHRSRIDGTAQPYRVVVPDSYDGSRAMPLYVYLHGRQQTEFEVSWLAAPDRPNTPESANDRLRLQVYGRSNNGFHWAGETDVFEAIASVRKRYNVDPDRIVLSGFSMGGVGAWHIGLHHPSDFAALEAGAGSSKSRRNAASLPPVQQAAMQIYENMADSALNLLNLPAAGYGGENDPQLQASVNVREQLAKDGYKFERQGSTWRARGLPALFLTGPKTGHTVDPDSRKQMDDFLSAAAARGRVTPDHVRFVTYTVRYNHSYWITLAGLQQQYQRAEVDGRRDDAQSSYTIRTKNVSLLILTDAAKARKVSIDGDSVTVRPASRLLFENVSGHWKAAGQDSEVLRKRRGLQGPIDDAFMDAFLCVRPTGQALNPIADEYARREMEQFGGLFAKFFRGEARVKDDTAITAADIANNNLILFGDPGSNKLIARVLSKLPIRWTKESISIGERSYGAAEHVPVMIYPNPLNPKRYVALNTGNTFAERDYRGDYLLPRFGDYAVLKVSKQPSEIAESGFFDESWKLPAK